MSRPTVAVALRLIASRARGADAAIVTVRADLSDLTRDAAVRHAAQVLNAMVLRYPGQTVDVQLLDAGNVPMLFVTGGAS